MDFDKIIKDLKAEKPESKEDALETKEDIKTFTLLKKIKDKKIKTKSDFNKAFSTLCWGSIAFCCDVTNPCLMRNAVLDALGISIDDYSRIKKRWDKEFIETFLNRKVE